MYPAQNFTLTLSILRLRVKIKGGISMYFDTS